MSPSAAHILVLDDDADVAYAATLLLRRHVARVDSLAHPADLSRYLQGRTPDIVLLDFNFAPGSLPYGTFTAAELDDSADAGPTCCQDPDLRNADSKLDQRIDLVWTRGGFLASGADRLGETPGDKTSSGLWPSDHAGVKVTLSR